MVPIVASDLGHLERLLLLLGLVDGVRGEHDLLYLVEQVHCPLALQVFQLLEKDVFSPLLLHLVLAHVQQAVGDSLD